MSFRCDWCARVIWQSMYRVVTKKKDKLYTQERVKYVKGEKTTQTKTSKGWEIAEEINVCKKCKEEITKPKISEVSIGQ